MSAPASATSSPPSSSAGPDWNLVPFAVNCARCGQDLRGQTEAKCPACALEFDWRDACPIEQLKCAKCGYRLYGLRETRCPECGEWFDWRLVILDYRRRQKDLFEYRWREQPGRSFFRTWARCFRPKRLWRFVELHDPADRTSLLIYVGLVFLVSSAVWVVEATALHVFERSTLWATPLTAAALFQTITDSFMQGTADVSEGLLYIGLPLAVWWAASIGLLFVLRQSMSQHRVRPAHLLRIAAYGPPSTIILMPTAFYVFMAVAIYTSLPMLFNSIGLLVLATAALVVAFTMLSIARAYRLYLRIPHAFGVGLASQVAGVLSALLLLCWTDSPLLGLIVRALM